MTLESTKLSYFLSAPFAFRFIIFLLLGMYMFFIFATFFLHLSKRTNERKKCKDCFISQSCAVDWHMT